jgi:hypothetical protein
MLFGLEPSFSIMYTFCAKTLVCSIVYTFTQENNCQSRFFKNSSKIMSRNYLFLSKSPKSYGMITDKLKYHC